MTVSSYFNHISDSAEQSLIQSLTDEVIQLKGMDLKYVPRTTVAYDSLMHEDPSAKFTTAPYTIEMYLETNEGWEGEGEMLEKFGMVVNEQLILTVSPNRFTTVTSMTKPKKGDLVYIPFTDMLVEIMKVSHQGQEMASYIKGDQTQWRLTCELFEYAGEEITTGDSDIDEVEDDNDTLAEDPFADNTAFETAGDAIKDFTETDPFGDS